MIGSSARFGRFAVLTAFGVSCGFVSAGELKRSSGALTPVGQRPIAYYVIDSGVVGPTVLIVGGVHGDEPAGAAAANQIRSWPVKRGRLIVLPAANPAALAAAKRTAPKLATETANLNRNFPSTRPEDAPQGKQAEVIWEFVKQQRPAWLIDLHEGLPKGEANASNVGDGIIAYPSDETLKAVPLMLEAVNATIADQERHFVRRGSPIGGSLARAAAVQLGANAMIIETTKRTEPVSLRTRQHRVLVHRLLRHLEMIDESVTPDRITPQERTAGEVFVALYDAGGTGGQGVSRVQAILGAVPGMHVEHVGPADIRAGVLKQFDAVVFSGGSGSKQAAALGEDGRREVKQFVEQGGGYLGICAGAYLACRGFSWGLGILDAKTKSPLWQRGKGTVQLEAAGEGEQLLGLPHGQVGILYASGPILEPANADDVPDFKTLARFVTEVAGNGTPKGIMVDAPAMVAGSFGRGRVVCFSPHPEQTKGLEGCVVKAVQWIAGRS